LTVGDRVGATSYPAQSAGDALGERAAATKWRTWPERAADANLLGGRRQDHFVCQPFFNVVPSDKRGQVRSFDSGVPPVPDHVAQSVVVHST